jgi:hypothetical protein
MSTSGQDDRRQQIFHGPASFGGDNNGVINNNVLLKAKTEAAIDDINRKAPELAAALRKAVRDGIMSPDAVIALNRAVEHLNEDTAQSFRFAAEHINEDTAISFESIAQDFINVDDRLSATVSRLDYATQSLSKIIGQVDEIHGLDAPGYQVQPPSLERRSGRSAGDWKFRVGLIFFSLGAGLFAAALLTRDHFGGQAIFAGISAMAFPVVSWVIKVRQ